jgi:hypothetical protein
MGSPVARLPEGLLGGLPPGVNVPTLGTLYTPAAGRSGTGWDMPAQVRRDSVRRQLSENLTTDAGFRVRRCLPSGGPLSR